MATIYPYPIEKFKSETEEKLYLKLQEELSDDYSIYYGRRWRDKQLKQLSEIECDFIVTKKNSGILLLEVKGGVWDRENGNWLRNGEIVKEDDDPFLQVIKIKHSLLNLLKSKSRWSNEWFPLDYAICLPDSKFDPEDISDLPEILTYIEYDYLDLWIEDCMKNCLIINDSRTTTQEMVDHLHGTLLRSHEARLDEILDIDEKKLVYLTNEELRLDDNLKKIKNLTIQGCAGSGKTLMALRQVKRLAQNNNVKNILFTCFNEELGKYLKANTESIIDKCQTLPIMRFFEKYAIEMKLLDDIDEQKKDSQYWDHMPFHFLEANRTLNLKFDAIVIDEGQSFEKDWWEIIDLLLKNPEESFRYIFFDNFQRIYHEVINPIPGENQAIELTTNIRNTANIHKHAIRFLPTENLPKCNNIIGNKVKVGFYQDSREMKKILRGVFHELVVEGGISTKDIILLTPKSKTSDFVEREKYGNFELFPIETKSPNGIRFSTIQKFRGMERKAVIITELDADVENLETLYYMGTSRAKTLLVILACCDLDKDFINKLTEGAELIS